MTTTESVDIPDDLDDIPTYSQTFREYLSEQKWISPADAPLVHHIRILCRQLDGAGVEKAAHASAYLQAIDRLEKRRRIAEGIKIPPGLLPDGGIPGQTSIFEHLDDDE